MIRSTIFYNTYPFMGFFRQQLKEETGFVKFVVSSKIRFKPTFNFYRGTELAYTAIMSKANLTKFKFDLEDTEDKIVATIMEKSIVEKKTIFREYSIAIGTEVFYVQYEMANRSFTIKDRLNNLVVQGKLVSSLLMNIFNFKKYKVDFYKNAVPEELWMAIVYGVFILE